MPASSLIFLLILFICAGYLVPAAIRRRRHTEQARTQDRDSAALRVVVRSGSAVLAAPTPAALAGGSSRPVLGSGPAGAHTVSPAVEPAPAAVPVRRTASSRVVARRRRLLGTVLALALLAWGVAAVGAVPWWVALVPTVAVGVVVAALTRHAATARVRTAPGVRVVVESPRERAVETTAVLPVVTAPAVPTPREQSTPAASSTPGPDGDSWAPVPVPLPTYLLKPKAPARPAPVAEPAVEEIVLQDAPTEVIDLRQQVRAVNE